MGTHTQSTFRRYLESPRAQRRAFWIGLGILAIGAAALVFAFFRNTGHPFPGTLSNKPAQIYHRPNTVPVEPEMIKIAQTFIATAVARKNIEASYDITGPDLRGRMTPSQWAKGNIPVIFYPADRVTVDAFRIDYSYPNSALLEVTLRPRAGSDERPLPFYIGFKKVGNGPSAHWVVSYWGPHYHPPIPIGNG